MAYHANDTDPPNCPICDTELHSINTKRIGNKAVCKDCAFKLMELWNAIGDKLIDEVIARGDWNWQVSGELVIDALADRYGVVI